MIKSCVIELGAMQDGAAEIGAAEISAAQIAPLQLGFPKIAAPAVLDCAREERFAVGWGGRRRWLIPGHRGPGREHEHEGRRDRAEQAAGWRSPGGSSMIHPLSLDLIVLAALQSIKSANRPQTMPGRRAAPNF